MNETLLPNRLLRVRAEGSDRAAVLRLYPPTRMSSRTFRSRPSEHRSRRCPVDFQTYMVASGRFRSVDSPDRPIRRVTNRPGVFDGGPAQLNFPVPLLTVRTCEFVDGVPVTAVSASPATFTSTCAIWGWSRSGDRTPICREPLRRTRFGSCSAWLAGRFERARLDIPFIEEGVSIHDAALAQLAGACLDVSARTVGLGIQHRMPVLKWPHGRTARPR